MQSAAPLLYRSIHLLTTGILGVCGANVHVPVLLELPTAWEWAGAISAEQPLQRKLPSGLHFGQNEGFLRLFYNLVFGLPFSLALSPSAEQS